MEMLGLSATSAAMTADAWRACCGRRARSFNPQPQPRSFFFLSRAEYLLGLIPRGTTSMSG